MSSGESATSTRNYLPELLANAPQDVVAIDTSMHYGDESKYVSVRFDPQEYPTVELIHITDVQFGHIACRVDRFIEFRDWILSVPNRFVLFGGDMVDAATVLSVGSPYENTQEPRGQVARFVELANPMRHRVLGYVGGNHERRSVKTYGDLGHEIAKWLRVPYSSGKQLIDIHYGKHEPYKVAIWHGGSGSRTKGSKMQMLHRFMTQGDSHLYLVGHLHDAMVTFDWREKRKQGAIVLEKFAGAMSSSFLEWWGTYAEVAGLAPSDTMMARVILEPSGHWELTMR